MLTSEPETSVPIRYATNPQLWLEVAVPASNNPGLAWEVEEEGTPFEIDMIVKRRGFCPAGWAHFLKPLGRIILPCRCYRVVTAFDEGTPEVQQLMLGLGSRNRYPYVTPRNERTADWLAKILICLRSVDVTVEPFKPVPVQPNVLGGLLQCYEQERLLPRL